MIRVTVPATSANMGSGFDSIGIALTLSNVVTIELWDSLDIACETGHRIPLNERNLVYQCAKRIFDICGKPLPGLRIRERCHIPMTRGLGSSSAGTVAGVLGANALLDCPLSRQELIDIAAVIEGHPDNSTPAILGGFVAALLENGHVSQVRVPVAGDLYFAAFIPEFELKTEKARAVLPEKINRQDAIFNLSRAALLVGSMQSGAWHNLDAAVGDCLHQPYRFPLIPGGEGVMALARETGARGAFISGAGPTILAITDDKAYVERTKPLLVERYPEWSLRLLKCDHNGAMVQRKEKEGWVIIP